MKKMIGLLAVISNLASANTSLLYDLECSDGINRVFVQVEKGSQVEFKDAYDLEIKKAKASVSVITPKNKYSYSKNIFVMDEGNGNFRFKAYSVGAFFDMEEVANLYYEHEGHYIAGSIKRPSLEGDQIFLKDFAFNEMKCKGDF